MTPIYINGCYGMLHPAPGRRGVVICGSLGDEASNTHRALVFLAKSLADAGNPTLRINYYGSGESAGDDNEPDRLRSWIDSVIAAVRWMRATCGVTSVALCGLRIGAVLAASAAAELDDVDALIMLAPVISGRRFLREQILAARTNAEIWQSSGDIDDGQWFEAFGLRLHRVTRDALDALDLRHLPYAPGRRVLLLDQPSAVASNRLPDLLRAQSLQVTHEPFVGSDRLLRDSHESEVPHAAFDRVATWLGECDAANRPNDNLPTACLDLGTHQEIPLRLRSNGQLAGILAQPTQRDDTAPVVLICSTGANPSFGNSRGAVAIARWLAAHGIASLRMDGSGIGDSDIRTGECGQPYSKQGDADVSAGVDALAARFNAPIIAFGMCSGAYHAFQAALNDHRINGLILVNLQKFVWRGDESLTVVQRTTLRTTGFYLRNIASREVWHRLLRGQINVGGIVRALASRAARQLAAAADPAIAAVSGETRIGMVRRQLAELARRKVQILYVLSGNDPGLDEIAEYFGIRGWRLRHHPGVLLHIIKDADHTLSAHWARQRLRQVMAMYLRQRFGIAIRADTPQSKLAQSPRNPRRFAAIIRRPRGNVIDSAPTAA